VQQCGALAKQRRGAAGAAHLHHAAGVELIAQHLHLRVVRQVAAPHERKVV
jgi:hypothetical protein